MTTSTGGRRGRSVVRRRTSLLLLAGALAELVGHKKSATAAPTKTASSPLADLKGLGPSHRVRAIVHHGDTYRVTMGDGRTSVFAETNLRFKVDSSFLGPPPGTPVLLSAGTIGDRAWVFFAAPGEIGSFITDQG